MTKLSETINSISSATDNKRKRILLGQLASNGDCLYATTLARQIKHDYPNCYLTWAVSSLCRGMVDGNPFVDEIWEIPVTTLNHVQMAADWYRFEQEVKNRTNKGDFDEIFLTQIYPNNYQNYDGTIRSSIFRAYPNPITVTVQNILRLRDDEVQNVRLFAEKHHLSKRNHVILFEYTSNSSQSFVNLDYAFYVAQSIISLVPDCSIILSSHQPIHTTDERIIDGSVLSLRENAELTKYCTLFIGCSSGVTQTALTDWAKPLPMIQLLLASQSVFASVAHDFEYWGYSPKHILEMTNLQANQLIECVYTALTQEFSQAYNEFHQRIPLDFNFYLNHLYSTFLRKEQYVEAIRSILNAVERYGWHEQIKNFVQTELMPKIKIRIQQSQSPKLNTYSKLIQNLNSHQTDILNNETNYDQKIKVALDISVLGLGTILKSAKTGVFRVTEYLLMGLINSFECEVYLCTSISNLFDACQTYINNALSYKNIRLFQLSDLQYQNIDVYQSTYYPLPNNIYFATRIITVCDLIPILYPEYFNHNSDNIIRNTIDSIDQNDLVSCISKSTKQDICKYRTDISEEQVFVTYLGADKDKFYQCSDRALINKTQKKYKIPDQPYLLSLSTLEPRKNIAHVIRCFLKLIKEKQIDDLNLVLIGTKGWQYEEIFAEIDRNQELVNRIVVTGYLPDKDLAPLYSGALGFMYVSLYEGFGLPPLEAMQCGTPVITSNTSSLPEVVGDAGIMLDPHDEIGLCDAIFKLYSDTEYRGNLAEKSVKQAQKFSWDKYVEETIKIYELAKEKSKKLPPRDIIVDGVFFQLYKTGIARVWKSLLEQWANTEFANHILVLDRANTAPKINGIRYRSISPYNYNDTESDRQMLQQICDEEGAELFISTYYTTPINTPSVFMAYDMIPEVLGGNLNEPMWIEKHNAIKHASAFISISENTAKDLSTFFPNISLESITVAHCGVDPLFSPASENEINAFKYKYGINKPYFLLGGLGGYKNSILFLQAFSQLINKHSFDIVATGAGSQLPPEWRQYTAGCTFHGLQLSDAELRLAYAGAVALVYPSQYEGFGMPVAEAMACGCPVITTRNASLPEVGGEAVIYVKDDDIEGMTNALCDVQKPSLRRNLIQAGLQQSQKFSWDKMADIVSNVLVSQTLESLPFNLGEINLIMFPDWNQSEDDLYVQLGEVIKALATDSHADETTLLIYVSNSDPETADGILSSIAMNLIMEDEIYITESIQISLIEEISEKQWQTLLPHLQSRVVLELENQEAIAKFQADTLPTFEIGL